MTHTSSSPSLEVIRQASEWLVALREPDASAELRGEFADWLRASPVHVLAYFQVAELWGDLAQVRKDFPTETHSDAAPGRSNVVSLSASRHTSPLLPALNARRSRRTWLLRGVAALIALVMACAWVVWETSYPTYAAPIGEQRIITLEDGSVVTLNSRARIRVQFSTASRDIKLLAGQAFFEVAKNPTRPFVVDSSSVAIRATGTKFDVFHRTKGTVVTVIEGHVQVSLSAEAASSSPFDAAAHLAAEQLVALSANEQAELGTDGSVERRDGANIAQATSWLRHELVFDGATLGDAVEEFNQYTRRPIVIADPALSALRISGVFHSTNPDSLLHYIGRLDGVSVEESSSQIRISRNRKP